MPSTLTMQNAIYSNIFQNVLFNKIFFAVMSTVILGNYFSVSEMFPLGTYIRQNVNILSEHNAFSKYEGTFRYSYTQETQVMQLSR